MAEFDAASAKAAIESDKKKREKLCGDEIKKLLEAHRCKLDSSVHIRGGTVIPVIHIEAET